MAGFSRALAVKIFNATLNGAGRSNLTAITNLYLSLHIAAQGDDATPESEVAYSGYSRYNIGAVFALTTDETVGDEVTLVAHNTAAVEFGASATATPVVISNWGIWDAASGGSAANLLYSGALLDSLGDPTTRTIEEGDIPIFQSGQLKLKLV